jgi:hypothetical protein
MLFTPGSRWAESLAVDPRDVVNSLAVIDSLGIINCFVVIDSFVVESQRRISETKQNLRQWQKTSGLQSIAPLKMSIPRNLTKTLQINTVDSITGGNIRVNSIQFPFGKREIDVWSIQRPGQCEYNSVDFSSFGI